MFGKKEKRFVVVEDQSIGLGGGLQIIVDKKTGVHYLNVVGTGMNGITPLLDEHGNVVVDKSIIEIYE